MKQLSTFLSIFFLIISTQIVHAGDEPMLVGARPMALGGAYVGVRGNYWGLYTNPATMATMSNIQAGVYVERRFMMKELTYGNAGVAIPFKDKHVIGASFGSFGFDQYRESSVGIAYATNVLDIFSMGVKLNYANLAIQDYGSAGAFFIDIGLNTAINKQISLGFHAYNVNFSKLSSNLEERIPTVFTAGIAYEPSEKVLVVADVQKDVDHPVSFRGGLEYQFIDEVSARVGMRTNPLVWTGGIGADLKGVQFDFTASFHETLGFTPHISLGYYFDKKEKN